jgi:hypothetical protein
MFIGRTIQGPVNEPIECLSYSDYVRVFTADTSYSDMALQVQQFFLNGGNQCYVLRIVNAATATYANAILQSVNSVTALVLVANSPGQSGNMLQCVVDYKTANPESTFNLTVYTYTINASGQQVIGTSEYWPALTMNPGSPKFAITYLNQQSNLVNAPTTQALIAGINGYSRSGKAVALADLLTMLTGSQYNLMVSINGGSARQVSLYFAYPAGTTAAQIGTQIGSQLQGAFPGVTFTVDCSQTTSDGNFFVIIELTSAGAYDINIGPALTNDLAKVMLFGVNQGGIEKSGFADSRPAPTGVVFNPTNPNLNTFTGYAGSVIQTMQVNGLPSTAAPTGIANTATLIYYGPNTPADYDGVRENWALMAAALSSAGINWIGQVWGSRLAILPSSGSGNIIGTLKTGGTDIGTTFTSNVSYYNFGISANQGFQLASTSLGADGNAPSSTDYANAFQLIDNAVDLFNLMILAKDNTTGTGANAPTNLAAIWGPASAFCQQRRALLLVDPPDTPDTSTVAPWVTSGASGSQIAQNATNLSKGVNALRKGLVNDHSALYFPRVLLNQNNLSYPLAPSGTLAGIMSRIDSSRGVWKAPAGIEANLLGVSGLEVQFTDGQNGVMNPAGINVLRVFPDGIVSWGARTLDGDDSFQSQWKYIPVRRTAMYIEESLYRGLKWVVFEPNAEPLWSQIRLNVGSFMQQMFIQGAFAGTTKATAYFVACDSTTTTQNDVDLGIVNIIVGFAPLLPAEFVILSIQQMAGQIQV